ncbi:hypothetical protein HYT57_04385 [Candidatus Woesearchaeota archaeon]|nr:hypothetical protein [Candidatus Woesearchaeota archaeon]
MEQIELNKKKEILFSPKPPFHFDATLHKPSHFPSSDNGWEKGKYWITMQWNNENLGLKLEDKGTISSPKVKITIYSEKELDKDFIEDLKKELEWRFNFNSDISDFSKKFKNDKVLGSIIKKWKGMRPVAANSVYETLIIYIVLQNATVRRSVQMLENLFAKFGSKLVFDGKTLSCFWISSEMAKVEEQELRDIKVGYRAKFLKRISEQFVNKKIDEFAMRNKTNEAIKKDVLKLYGIGPASVEYLLFEDFYRYDAFTTIPPWEQKILSMLIFKKPLVPTSKILKFAKRYGKYKKLAIHYIWEDIFWKRKHKSIPWLEKEIRL